jgi:hypothetical protein
LNLQLTDILQDFPVFILCILAIPVQLAIWERVLELIETAVVRVGKDIVVITNLSLSVGLVLVKVRQHVSNFSVGRILNMW